MRHKYLLFTGAVIFIQLFLISTGVIGQTFIWARSFGSLQNDLGSRTTVDGNNDIIICGTFQDTLDADPGPGQYNIVPIGVTDILIEKLDSAGNMIWAGSIGCSNYNLVVSDVK